MKYRSVQYGVVFISLLCIAILVISMLFYYKTMSKQNQAISSLSNKQRNELINNVLDVSKQRCEAVVHENSAWDDLKDYVLSSNRDADWACDNIGPMSESFNAANVAIFSAEGKLIYQNPTPDYENMDLFGEIMFQSLLTDKSKANFFLNNGNRVFEYFCQGIVSSEDINTRQEIPVGVLAFVREINDSLLTTYAKSLGGIEVRFVDSKIDLDEAEKANKGKFFTSVELNNQFGNPVGYLYFDAIDQLSVIQKGVVPVMIVFAAVVIFTFFMILVFVRLRIISPLKKITDTFSTEDLSKIKALKKKKTEFGVLSNYLDKFIVQKQKLEQLNADMEEKQQELMSQNDLLESQKKEIENQIENANVLNQQIIDRNRETEKKNVQISVQNEQLVEQSKILQANQAAIEDLDYKLNFTSKQLSDTQAEMADSQNYAIRLRNVLMIASTPSKHILNDFFVFQMMKEKVGGDFVFAKKVDKWVITAVGNCNLSGIPGSMLSALDIYLLNEVIDFSKAAEMRPDLILNTLNKKIIASSAEEFKTDINRDGLHISLFMYDTQAMKGYFSAAKRTMVIIRKGEDTEYFGDNLSVGKITDDKQFRVLEFKVMPDDMVYMYSDGCTEVVGGPFCKKVSPVNIKKHLLQKYQYPLMTQKLELKHFYEDWLGDLELTSDVTFLGFKI